MSSLFINKKTNQVFKENDTLRMPKLANTLNIISENSSVFYDGFLTDLMVHEINENGLIFIMIFYLLKIFFIYSNIISGILIFVIKGGKNQENF